ncbi:ABC transporter ATP-binding protein [Prauserella muralis]|uniref:ABC transporter ATP-binding protein n=1 Tax=Prauserella muralis TaxID=588067 RepID=A0A2V4B1M2_9PSEU|nr:ABC transporter ATP-binding protein [Prauserella muralis]PXY27937.1 ABC transporter ATP-binding protein [Prauserella muralis]TWE22279.1 ABC-2 type transport system ATP-binding protein [Prauserella muralis]
MAVARMHDVTKRYGDFAALSGVSLGLAENRIHGLLGRNGAGKTTIMQILTGQNFATTGQVEVFGEHPYENERVLRNVCFIKEAQRYPDIFSVRHAFAAARLLYPNWDQEFAEQLTAEFDLPVKRNVKKLSRGQLSAVGVIIGLAARAPLTFFDEPYLGLDAVARHTFYDRLLADYAEHPRTIVLSTHLIDEVADLIEHVVVVDHGRVLLDEDADLLRSRAVTVSGPTQAVEAFAHGYTELHRERMGGFLRVTLEGAEPDHETDSLQFEPVSLQELVVRTTQQAGGQELVGTANGKGGHR